MSVSVLEDPTPERETPKFNRRSERAHDHPADPPPATGKQNYCIFEFCAQPSDPHAWPATRQVMPSCDAGYTGVIIPSASGRAGEHVGRWKYMHGHTATQPPSQRERDSGRCAGAWPHDGFPMHRQALHNNSQSQAKVKECFGGMSHVPSRTISANLHGGET